jgi:hypothetical protein
MSGELHDIEFPDRPSWYDQRTEESGHMLTAALSFLGFYYVIVKPISLLYPGLISKHFGLSEDELHPSDLEITPRFPCYLKSWREYQNLQ